MDIKLVFLLFFFFHSGSVPTRRLDHLDAVLKVPFKALIGGRKTRKSVIWGEEVRRNSKPFQAALLIWNEGNVYFCSGVLISDEWVLSSARCMSGAGSVDVILGAHNITENTHHEAIFRSSDIITHHWYRPANLAHDVALIRLPQKVPVTKEIRPIKLPNDEPMYGEPMIQSAWGKTGDCDGRGGIADVLKSTNITSTDKRNCLYQYWFLGTEGMLCIDPLYEGACNGDFGAPITDSKAEHLYGLSAFVSPGRCGPHDFGIITSTFHCLDWINFHTGLNPSNIHTGL